MTFPFGSRSSTSTRSAREGDSSRTSTRGGGLRVGPDSAGAMPGPACYGVGLRCHGDRRALSSAGSIPVYFLGGRMRLDVDRARHAAASLARRLRLSVEELAEGIIRVANASMLRAIRVVSLERGHDPRRFALVAFGGAGGNARRRPRCGARHQDRPGSASCRSVVRARHVGGRCHARLLGVGAATSDGLSMSALTPRASPLVARARRELVAEGFRGASADRRTTASTCGTSGSRTS